MTDARELSQRLLAELFEAGEDGVPTLLNTIDAQVGSNEKICNFAIALEDLVIADLVLLFVARIPEVGPVALSKQESLLLARNLPAHVVFDTSRGMWKLTGAVHPQIIVTDRGMLLSEEILAERGYRWWE
jgi:hypothetical protein